MPPANPIAIAVVSEEGDHGIVHGEVGNKVAVAVHDVPEGEGAGFDIQLDENVKRIGEELDAGVAVLGLHDLKELDGTVHPARAPLQPPSLPPPVIHHSPHWLRRLLPLPAKWPSSIVPPPMTTRSLLLE